jgi:hypothetical protein
LELSNFFIIFCAKFSSFFLLILLILCNFLSALSFTVSDTLLVFSLLFLHLVVQVVDFNFHTIIGFYVIVANLHSNNTVNKQWEMKSDLFQKVIKLKF